MGLLIEHYVSVCTSINIWEEKIIMGKDLPRHSYSYCDAMKCLIPYKLLGNRYMET